MQPPVQYIAFYGTLNTPAAFGTLGLHKYLTHEGECELRGDLYHIIDPDAQEHYPGMVPGHGKVKAQLFSFQDDAFLSKTDAHEDCIPGDPGLSTYRREKLPVLNSDIDAWVYVYCQPTMPFDRIPGGDWQEYLRDLHRQSAQAALPALRRRGPSF